MPKKTALYISVGLVLLSILFGWQYYQCPISFNTEIKAGEVLALLTNFGVIAILIERFTNQIIIKDDYRVYVSSIKAPKPNYQLGARTIAHADVDNDYHKKYYWITFGIGLLVAGIGFRYFQNVVELESLCKDTFKQPEIFALVDMFLSGILMSGGSTLVLSVIEWWKKPEAS